MGCGFDGAPSMRMSLILSIEEYVLGKGLKLDLDLIEAGHVLLELGDEERDPTLLERLRIDYLLVQPRLAHFGRGDDRRFCVRLPDALQEHGFFRFALVMLDGAVGRALEIGFGPGCQWIARGPHVPWAPEPPPQS